MCCIFTVFSDFSSFFCLFVCLFCWIEKQSSHGRALEYLESSGSKIMMGGSIVCRCGKTQKTNTDSLMMFFSPHFNGSLRCRFLAKASGHAWSHFVTNIS